MKLKYNVNFEENMLLDMNRAVYNNPPTFRYHMEHIKLVRKYAILLNKRLHANVSNHKLGYIALAHDLLKEKGLDPKSEYTEFNGYKIPQDVIRYTRMNLDILEEYGLDEYFNTSCQYHALAAGIFLIKEIGIQDPEILYPVMFHSCPIISVYETLPKKIQTMIDIIMLSDKLSSNYLRINLRGSEVRIDLDLTVFGYNGTELNYTLGLFLARLISQGKSTEEQSLIATDYYYNRLKKVNPIISKEYSIKTLGGNIKWEKRKSQAFRMQ